ncbi:hypothetical protein CcI49_02995 [Frankia sp. CcI49]|uniref:DUF3987 domain-containing protein n=1 Tax=Frankia sp. CcI49 TaxID=1745382 RepID=UPI0009783652|nr:DUF3987 domain-containing protein [Frankia sp. CcI49]ONH62362.1 hypothetical protein CcI49_02995 [Frankia sp. CcI49]
MTQTTNAQVSATAAPLAAALPGGAGRIATTVAASAQLPTALTALAALSMLSAATRGRWRVRLAPDWTESLALYTAGLAGPGRGKSYALWPLAAPIFEKDWELEQARLRALPRDRDITARLEAAIETGTHGAHGERGPALTEPIDPVRLWFADVTPDYLPAFLARHGGTSAHFGDGELLRAVAETDDSAGRTTLVKAYDGDRLRVDRLGQPSDEFGSAELVTADLDEPFLAVAVLAQPDLLGEAQRNPTLRPLLARFLFAVAPPIVGTRSLDAPEVPSDVTAQWDRTVRALLGTALAAETVTELELTPEAGEVFTAFRAGWEPRLHPETGDLAVIAPWASKYPGTVARIAALLALADDPATAQVGVEHMTAAVKLAKTHVAGARAVLAGAAVAA